MKAMWFSVVACWRRFVALLAGASLVGQGFVGLAVSLPLLLLPTPAQATCAWAGTFSGTITYSTLASFTTDQSLTVSRNMTCSGTDGTDIYLVCAAFGYSSAAGFTVARTTNASDTKPIALKTFDLNNGGITYPVQNTSTYYSLGAVIFGNGTKSAKYLFFIPANTFSIDTPPGTYSGTGSLNSVSLSGQDTSDGSCVGGGFSGTNASTTWTSKVVISPFCVIASVGSMNFGTITSTATATNAVAAVNFSCNQSTPYTVTLGDGLARVGVGTGLRRMQNGTNRLSYQLYSDAARTVQWASAGVSGVGSGSTALVKSVYGQIPAGTTLPPSGSYSDTVVVTITY